jgi:hypothetical protein
MIFSLIEGTSGGVEGTDTIERYLPVPFGDPALFVLVIRNGRRCNRGGREEAGVLHGGLRCCKRVGLLVRMQLGSQCGCLVKLRRRVDVRMWMKSLRR